MSKNVIRVTSLADFAREVPPGADLRGRKPVVRLINTRVEGEHSAALALHLQGEDSDGRIVWLCEVHTISWLYGKPFGHAAECVHEQMRELERIVRGWLAAQGYEVRNGNYGIPDNVKPLAASFECARWVKESEAQWKVVAV